MLQRYKYDGLNLKEMPSPRLNTYGPTVAPIESRRASRYYGRLALR